MSRRVLSRLLGRTRAEALRTLQFAGDVAQAIIMVGILKPTAAMLPYRGALALARCFGFANAMMPWYGRRTLLQMRHAFGQDLDTKQTLELAAKRLAQPLRDSVVIRRALRGRSDLQRWQVQQRTTESVEQIRNSDESYILATGHFSRQAFMPLISKGVIPNRIFQVMLPAKQRTLHPGTWWLSYHYGQIVEYLRVLRPDTEFVYPQQGVAFRRIVEALGKPRNVVVIYADAPWGEAKGRSYSRPFAGLDNRSFATGVARLSRASRRPIIVCIPYMEDEQTVVLDWLRVIRPQPGRDPGMDRSVTDLILNDIETAIGKRPSQYLLDCLGNRSWDPAAEQWGP